MTTHGAQAALRLQYQRIVRADFMGPDRGCASAVVVLPFAILIANIVVSPDLAGDNDSPDACGFSLAVSFRRLPTFLRGVLPTYLNWDSEECTWLLLHVGVILFTLLFCDLIAWEDCVVLDRRVLLIFARPDVARSALSRDGCSDLPRSLSCICALDQREDPVFILLAGFLHLSAE